MTFARTSLSLIYSQCCHEVSHLCRIWFAIQSHLSRKYAVFQNDCDLIARGRRQVRDGFETPAMTLQVFNEEFCCIKFLNMFKFFATTLRHLATLGDTCEQITNHWRLFRDGFATRSRFLSPAVAKQSQSSEIGALAVK